MRFVGVNMCAAVGLCCLVLAWSEVRSFLRDSRKRAQASPLHFLATATCLSSSAILAAALLSPKSGHSIAWPALCPPPASMSMPSLSLVRLLSCFSNLATESWAILSRLATAHGAVPLGWPILGLVRWDFWVPGSCGSTRCWACDISSASHVLAR